MKKLFVISLAMLMLVGLFACRNGNIVDIPTGGNDDDQGNNRPRPTPTVAPTPEPTDPPYEPIYFSPYIDERLIGKWVFWETDGGLMNEHNAFTLYADGTGINWIVCPDGQGRIPVNITWTAIDGVLTFYGLTNIWCDDNGMLTVDRAESGAYELHHGNRILSVDVWLASFHRYDIPLRVSEDWQGEDYDVDFEQFRSRYQDHQGDQDDDDQGGGNRPGRPGDGNEQ